jgi:hypothetical protein
LLDEGFSEIRKRRTMPVQEVSLPSAVAHAPIPLPPPMIDDVRGVDPALTTRADETDSAEDIPVYTRDDAQQINAMIDRVQEQPESTAMIDAPPLPVPRPEVEIKTASLSPVPMDEALAALPIPTPEPVREAAKTSPAGAARTVMQLRIPRDQLPKGVSAAQIASHNSASGWSIQVGAFPSRALTDQALRTARSRLPSHLQKGQPVIVPQSTGHGLVFRARLQGYDEISANAACAHLGSCLVVAPGS